MKSKSLDLDEDKVLRVRLLQSKDLEIGELKKHNVYLEECLTKYERIIRKDIKDNEKILVQIKD